MSLVELLIAIGAAAVGLLAFARKMRRSGEDSANTKAREDRETLQKNTSERMRHTSGVSDDEWLRQMAAKSASRHDRKR